MWAQKIKITGSDCCVFKFHQSIVEEKRFQSDSSIFKFLRGGLDTDASSRKDTIWKTGMEKRHGKKSLVVKIHWTRNTIFISLLSSRHWVLSNQCALRGNLSWKATSCILPLCALPAFLETVRILLLFFNKGILSPYSARRIDRNNNL